MTGEGDKWDRSAARGGLVGRRFPWGDSISHEQANYNSSALYSYDISPTRSYHPSYPGPWPSTSPVGSFAANRFGLYDLGGNAWEWSNAEGYPGYLKYTAESYRMQINEIIYALTH